MKNKKIIIIVAAVVAALLIIGGAVFFILSPKKEKPPEQFELHGTILPPLPVEQEEEFSVLEYETFMEGEGVPSDSTFIEPDSSVDPALAEKMQSFNPALMRTYTYANLTAPKEAAKSYVDMLLAEDMGFYAVDENMVKLHKIEWETIEDKIMLAKQELGQTGLLMRVDLSWTSDTCTVELYGQEGQMVDELPVRTMTYLQAAEYIKQFPPELLGLAGSSMEKYRVYTLDGGVLINDQACIRMTIYGDDVPTGTNEVVGRYFLSSDAAHFYQLVGEHQVKEIDLSQYAKEHNLKF